MTTIIAHHFLHNQCYGKSEGMRKDDHTVTIDLPDLDGGLLRYDLMIDIRDKRTLIVFDGNVPHGGIAKSGAIIRQDFLTVLYAPIKNVRNIKEGEDAPHYRIEKGYASLVLKRNFLLLPHSCSVLRAYRESLSPRYFFLEIDKKSRKDGKDRISYFTTTY